MNIFSRIKEASKVLFGSTKPKEEPVKDPPVSPRAPQPTPRPLPSYISKYEAFRKFANGHREHQATAIEASKKAPIGQICIPTGTGKTRIQVHLHVLDMLEKTEKQETGVYVITAHRLALCRQLLNELIDMVAHCHLPFDVLFVGSSRVDEDAVYEKYMMQGISKETTYIKVTTKQTEIKKTVNLARAEGRHTIIVSTYHSMDRLRKLDRIDTVTYDEAHTIASSRQSDDNFEAHVTEIQNLNIIQRQYFFTATRKVSGEDYGMNDKSVYGELLYEEPPINMIKAGEIVPPRIHRINPKDRGDFDNESMVIKTIMEAFSEHRRALRGASPLAGALGAKLLVGVEGSPSIRAIQDNIDFKVWCFTNNIKLFTFSSEYGYYMFGEDGVFSKVASRNKVFEAMKALKDNQDAILVHIDILTEGIDLPGITGVLPFRELNLIKLLQTIGRAARLLITDRKKLYSEVIRPMEWNKMIKPYCWVIIPMLKQDAGHIMEDTIKKVLDAYGTPTLEFSREDEYRGEPDPSLEPITPRDKPRGSDKESDLIHIIEDLMVGLEAPPFEDLGNHLIANADPSLRL